MSEPDRPIRNTRAVSIETQMRKYPDVPRWLIVRLVNDVAHRSEYRPPEGGVFRDGKPLTFEGEA